MKLRPSWTRVAVLALASGAVLGAGGGRTYAAFVATTSTPGSSLSSATLAAPTSLTAAAQADATTVRLTWAATTSAWATGHRVYRATAAGGPYTQVAEVGLSTTAYDDVPGSGAFFYIVRAYHGSGWISPNSNEAGPVTAGPTVDHFTFDTIPPERHSGRSFLITLRARSSSGATVTGFTGTVTFSVNSGAITPTTSYTFTNGVVTEPIRIIGPYTTAQTVTATSGSATGTSNAFRLHDWKYYAKKTTAFTGTNCATASRKRDLAEGYAGADPEETFAGGRAVTFSFCTDTFAAGEKLAAGTTKFYAYVGNTSGQGPCGITATLSVNGTTSLGSNVQTVPMGDGTPRLYTWSFTTPAVTFAAGDRLDLILTWENISRCADTTLYYGGTSRAAYLHLPGAPGSAYTDAVFATGGLVSYWRLDEPWGSTSAADSKSANPGTYNNAPWFSATSLLITDANPAVDFDGSSESVTVPDSPSLSPVSQLSVEAWVRVGWLPTSAMVIVEKDWSLRVDPQADGRQFSFSVNIGGVSEPRARSGIAPSTSSVYHVVGTYDGTNVRIYVNGQLKGTEVRPGIVFDGAGTLNIAGSSGVHWDGIVDEVAFYNVALTAAQVQEHYEAR